MNYIVGEYGSLVHKEIVKVIKEEKTNKKTNNKSQVTHRSW